MALLDEILTWTQTDLRHWQSDAVRRLFVGHELHPVDYDDLVAQLKHSKGIATSPLVVAVPLSDIHLPNVAVGPETLVLESLGRLKNVNRLAPDQSLQFAPKGMTVVYGENGAGKSGYSRVLKSACRARVKDEAVLADARLHPDFQETPEAVFLVSVNGTKSEVAWRDGEPAPKALASVAVLDTRCARAYTDQEGELIFVPWGLDVVENLARVVLPEMETRIRAELKTVPTSDDAFDDLKAGATATGAFIKALSHQTTDEVLASHLLMSVEQKARLALLQTALEEKSPAEAAKQLREAAARVQVAEARIAAVLSSIADERIRTLSELDANTVVALNAEAAAAELLRSGDTLLPGTGETAWKAMFAAAESFATAVHAHERSPIEACLLCQRTLDSVATDRLARFRNYVSADISAQAGRLQEERAIALASLRRADLSLTLEASTNELMESKCPGWTEALTHFQTSVEARRTWALAAGETHEWGNTPVLREDFAFPLEGLRLELTAQAKALEDTASATSLLSMRAECAELQAREAIGLRSAALTTLVENKRKHHLLTQCLADLKTKPISDKARALSSAAVTDGLIEALKEEFKLLGVTNLPMTLKSRNDQGATKVKLVLNLPGTNKPEHVFSEGEQRVIAIASFLAELKISGHKGAAVFDDPVSSLDHRRRQRVARRLVDEAKLRQIVVFTHDSIFLAELMDAIESAQAPHACLHLTYSPNDTGVVNDGLPWHHQPSANRIDAVDRLIRDFSASESSMDNVAAENAARNIYDRIRQVTERVVQDVVLGGVLQRYSDYVRVSNLRRASGIELSECDPLITLYEKASDVVNGHDKASARAFAPPSAAEAAEDLGRLKAVIEAIKTRRKLNGIN